MNKELLHRPVTPWVISQRFGENKACVDIATGRKVIGCDGNNPPEGYRSLYGPEGHKALDILARRGQEVYAAQRGFVSEIDTNPRSGLDVRIVSYISGRKIRHIYEHLLGYQHKVGDKVKTGQLVGWADNTGWSSGDHVHFQVEEYINNKWVPIDPESVLSTMPAKKVLLINNTLKYIFEQIALLSDRFADFLRNR